MSLISRQYRTQSQKEQEESEGFDNVFQTELQFRAYSILELAGRVSKLIKEDEEVVKD